LAQQESRQVTSHAMRELEWQSPPVPTASVPQRFIDFFA
jgi:hypothetical protein